jgi:RimJ/RimL family protein N-acetyltransferase
MHTAALVLADGARLGVRPISPDDRDTFSSWFGRLTPESRRRRFHGPKPKLSARELTYLTEVDHVTHTALMAVDAQGRMVGEARYATADPASRTADFAITVADAWQGRGVGSRLIGVLVERACEEGIRRFKAPVLTSNHEAIRVLERLGSTTRRPAGHEVELLIDLP